MGSEKNAELLRSIKFLLFSISAGLIEIVSFSLLKELTTWNYWPSYLIALLLSVIWNFTLNRRFTFKSANNIPVAMMKILGFYLVFTPVTTLMGEHLVETLLWNAYLVTVINMILNFVTEYIYDRFIVFGKTLDTNDLAKREQSIETEAVISKTPVESVD